MSALSVNDPGDPRSHRYYAPRQRRVVAREATLQPILERLRGGTRDYSADERLGGEADPVSMPETELIVVPGRRFSFAVVAAFAGGAAAMAAVAVAYIAFETNGFLPVAPAAASAAAPPVAQAPAAPAKIAARLTPNQPVSRARPAQSAQVATADAMAAVPVDTSKGDRLDASATPNVAASFDPLRSPLNLWGGSPTQAAIEGTDPALAAAGAPAAPAAPETTAAPPPHQVAQEQNAEHHAKAVRHHVRARHQARHVRHHKPTTTGQAASGGNGQTAATANGGAAQPTATKKFLGLFGG
jgi:hypothetical protein